MSNGNTTPAVASNAGGKGFGFADTGEKPSFKEILKKPATIISLVVLASILGVVIWLELTAETTELPPPRASYETLPNAGLTEGIPIVIKLNQVAIFQVSDPLDEGGSARRAQEIVANLEGAVQDLVDQPGREITLDEGGELPAIVQMASDGTGRRMIVQLTADDLTLAGITDAKFLARIWAERLTDALKVEMFGEAPEFSDQRPEFFDALTTMYLGARNERGVMSAESLDESFEQLTDAQKAALTALPPRPPAAEEDPAAEDGKS